MIKNGIATKVSEMITASTVNGIVIPNQLSRCTPSTPVRPSASSSATPATTGGRTSGSNTTARISRSPGMLIRAKTQASGTPKANDSAVDAVAASSESRSAGVMSCFDRIDSS